MKKIDKSNMRQVILDFPRQFRVGIRSLQDTRYKTQDKKKIENIIICGMGGSALPGDILKMSNVKCQMLKLPIFVHRNYGLSKEATKRSLVICISYSGNTEETLSAFNEAKRRKLKIAVVGSGGKIINLAKRNRFLYARVPSGLQPRCAIGYQFSAIVKLLSKLRVIKNIDKELLNLEKSLQPQKLEPIGKNLAKKIKDTIPLVYSSERWGVLAKIWKIKLNENSKVPAFFNVLPEMNHNEMAGIGETKSKKLKNLLRAIILRDRKDDKRILKRMEIVAQIFRAKGIKVIFVDINGKTFFEKFFSTMLISDWTSYYLAIFQGVDPTPIKLVEEFKKRIEKSK